ncbi:putative RNA-directed DNA polymerase, eukaryota, reverse transcriptase zinc-binding domain protein, partial [Tanacetum coccineum]
TPFSRVEIKKAVWDCGGDRAPGPDGFSFKFFTTFWDLIEDDVVRFVQEFSHTNIIPKGCNSSFIALISKVPNVKIVYDFRPISLIGCQYKIISKILANRHSKVIGNLISLVQTTFLKRRNILDGPLILNEVMAWYRQRKKALMVFKVDFEKAFDYIRWDYLDLILEKHGLRQGDHLSPFLFILAMEGLHAFMIKADDIGLFRGACIGRDNMRISHLMYADDVIFLGECNILGIGVSDDDVASMENVIGCATTNLPMKYLGVPVGCNMFRCSNWNAIITKFCSKLSFWKARILSIGGRLSLIKLILGSLPSYYMSLYLMPTTVHNKLESMRNKFFIGGDQEDKKATWVKWKKCMASKEHGGLGIGLWARVIQNLYGVDGGIYKVHACYSKRSTWGAIVHFISSLKFKVWILLTIVFPRNNWEWGDHSVEDVCVVNQPLKTQFPRMFLLDTDKDCFIASRVTLANWSLVLKRDLMGGIETNQFNALKSAIGGDDNKDLDFCPVCNTSRWKDSNTPGKKVPKKVLWYFPIIPRLQRLYKSSHTAKEMIWHATRKCTEPGLQHVASDIDNIQSASVVEDDPNIILFDNSSDLPLSTSLNDLDNATLHIDGQSTEVDALPYIIDVVDEDDDIIDDEDALPHDLAASDDEDLINVDDDGVDKMSADVARSHGGDGDGEDRPPPHHVPTGCGGCFANRGKGKRKPNLGGRAAGRLNTRDKTRNLSLKEITDKKGPVPIRFEVRDKQTLMPLGDHAAHWSSYIGEVIRGVPLYYPSWLKVPKERKAALITDIGTQFDLRPHMESPDWTEIEAGIQQHLQKAHNTNKAAFKAQH